jgi:hypothetical protein
MHVFADVISHDDRNQPYTTHSYNCLSVTNVAPSTPTIYTDMLSTIAVSIDKLHDLKTKQHRRDTIKSIDNDVLTYLCDEHNIIQADSDDKLIASEVSDMYVTNNKIEASNVVSRIHPYVCKALSDQIRELVRISHWTKADDDREFSATYIKDNTTNDYVFGKRLGKSGLEINNVQQIRAGNFVISLTDDGSIKKMQREVRSKQGCLPDNIITSCRALNLTARLYTHDFKFTVVCCKGSQLRPLDFVVSPTQATLCLDRPTYTTLFGYPNLPLQRYKYEWTRAINMYHITTLKNIIHGSKRDGGKKGCDSLILSRFGVLVYSHLQDQSDSFLVTFCPGNCKWNTTRGAHRIKVANKHTSEKNEFI